MDYIQHRFALSIKDNKNFLFEKYSSLKVDLLAHCKTPALNGLVVGSVDGDALKLEFPDLGYEVYASPRIAFNAELQAGLKIKFKDNYNEWVASLILNPNGFYSLSAKNGGPYLQYEYDDEKLPMVVIHALLTSAYQTGYITF